VGTNEIHDAVRHQPFQPFTLRLTDGRVLHVPEPGRVAVSSRMVYVYDADTDGFAWLEPQLIDAIEWDL
jgi:hypothetical protein